VALVDLTGDSTVDAWPTVQARRGRRRFAALTILTALALIAGIVFVAVNADGREVSRASSNDGGAWLVNRELAVVGHKNRAAGEISASIRVADSPTADIFQAAGVVVVHDASTNQLIEVDERAFAEDQQPTQLPEFTSVVAIDNGVVVVRTDPLSVWQVDIGTLRSLATLDGISPLATGSGTGRVAATPDGSIAVLDAEAGTVQWFRDGVAVGIPIVVDLDAEVVDFTIVDSSAVVLLSTGNLIVVGHELVEFTVVWADIGDDIAPLARLQQAVDDTAADETIPATSIVGISAQGAIVTVALDETVSATVRAELGAGSPLAPVVHDGCVHAVATSPPTYGVSCDRFVSRPLAGASQELRLRLVNGIVWVNDLEDGGTWVTNDDLEVEKIDDWSLAADSESDSDDSDDDDTGGDDATNRDELVVEDPDAIGEVQSSDDFNLTEENVPPIALDDEASTRSGRTSVIDVLANDSDANNDILVVISAELTTGDARVSVTPSGEEVQVTPSPGFTGIIELTYEISDGESDPVSAQVRLEVLPSEKTNTAPVATTDVVATAPGNSTTIDLLYNDTDAEGDALALVGIETETGTLRWDPTGQVTFTPDNNTEAGWIELPYTVRDARGAESQGLLRVEIRDLGANQEPDARNDHASTVVGRTVVVDLLANDSDPDGDPLIVGSQPVLLEPEGAVVQASATSDGEFVFSADVPGIYLFTYTITDSAIGGSESDSARIRIDVADNPVNEPPIAVRDDVVIPVAGTRSVFALDNDGDPSGDVVAIVDWQPAQGLSVIEINDGNGVVGFLITALPGAPPEVSFNYSISDGVNDPVTAPVVVVVVDETPTNQPPFAVDDVVEVRAGATVERLPVLANDFDPEGGALRVVSVGATDAAMVAIAPDAQAISIAVPDDATASFSVSYDIEDDAGNRAAAIARVQLLNADAPNRPPTARTDEGRVQQDTSIAIDVLANDSDPDADVIKLEGIVEQPSNGTARVGGDGIVVYQPDTGFTGTDHIRYAIVDINGDRDVGDIFIGVMEPPPANRSPIANDDAYDLGVPTITPLDVLTNDSDPDGDPIRVVSVTQPALGSAAINSLGQVVYTPPTRLAEPSAAVFDYTITDNAGNRDRATVTVTMDPFEADEPEQREEEFIEPEITPEPEIAPEPTPEPTPEVEPENELPVALDDNRGPIAAFSEVAVDVLDNDFDPDGPWEDLRVVEVSEPARLEGNTVIIAVREAAVKVTYTIEDAFGGEASAEVSVIVSENQAPTVEPLDVATEFETPITLDLAAQATDADNDELFFACCENIRGGVVRNITADAGVLTLTFVPDERFIGIAGFSYSVDDQNGHQTSGSVSIDVRAPGNRAPETIDDSVTIPQDTVRRIDLTELASDPDDDELAFTVLEQVGAGISAEIDGDFLVIAVDANATLGSGPVVVYEAFDGLLRTDGRVQIEVTPIGNEPPVTQDVDIEIAAGASDVVNLAFSTTETDVGDPTTWSIDETTVAPLRAELSGSSLQIFADGDLAGVTAAIGYTATDSRGAAATSVVNVVVIEPTAPVPVAVEDEASVRSGGTAIVDVLANDLDPLGDGLTLLTAVTDDGTATIQGGEIRFTHDGGSTNDAIVTYTIADAAGRPATGVLTVQITDRPDQMSPPDVTAGNGEVLIGWSTPNRNGSDITSYTITRFTGDLFCATGSLAGATCLVPVALVPGPDGLGSCPTAVDVAEVDGACVRFVQPQQSDGGVPDTAQIIVQNSFRWLSLDNGEASTFSVYATNGVGRSVPSDLSVPVTPNLVPEVPAAPQVVFGDELITVTWQPPTDNGGSPVDRYQLEIGGELSDVIPLGNVTEHVWRDLENGKEYNFRVSAGNDAGFSEFSAASPNENPETTPGAPTILSVERGSQSGSLTIEWIAPTNTGGGRIDDYRIIPSIGEAIETGDDGTSYDWLNLEFGVPITFEVQAHNRAGWSVVTSDPSDEAIPCGAPDAPVWVSVDRLDGAAQLIFEQPDLNGCGLTGYTITSTDLDTLETQVKNTQLTTFPFGEPNGDLTNGSRYTFEVRATNVFGTGLPSVASAEVIPAGPPICAADSAVTAQASDVGEITMTWQPATANGRPLRYQINPGTLWSDTDGGAQPGESIPNLDNGTLYNFEIRAINEVGASPTCGSASATTWDIPTPLIAVPNYDTATQTLTWTLSGGVSVGTPTTLWGITSYGTGGESCPVSATVISANGRCFTIIVPPPGEGCPAGTVETAFSTPNCERPVDLVPCGSCVIAGLWELQGTDDPIPPSFVNTISLEADYFATTIACNIVGCWDKSNTADPLFSAGVLTPPGRPDQMTVEVGNGGDAALSRSVSRTEWNRGVFDSIRLNSAPADNGSPITAYAWEYRRIHSDTGAVVFEDAGINSAAVIGGSLETIEYFGHSTHPLSLSGGEPWDIGIRVAAINSIGQAEWSEWDTWERRTGSSPLIRIMSSEVSPTCPIGDDECGIFNGWIRGFGPFQTYTFSLMNYEELYASFLPNTVVPFVDVVTPVRTCTGSVTADANGGGPFSIICDVGPTPGAIRLINQESYLSGGINIIDTVDPISDPDPGLWHFYPGLFAG